MSPPGERALEALRVAAARPSRRATVFYAGRHRNKPRAIRPRTTCPGPRHLGRREKSEAALGNQFAGRSTAGTSGTDVCRKELARPEKLISSQAVPPKVESGRHPESGPSAGRATESRPGNRATARAKTRSRRPKRMSMRRRPPWPEPNGTLSQKYSKRPAAGRFSTRCLRGRMGRPPAGRSWRCSRRKTSRSAPLCRKPASARSMPASGLRVTVDGAPAPARARLPLFRRRPNTRRRSFTARRAAANWSS